MNVVQNVVMILHLLLCVCAFPRVSLEIEQNTLMTPNSTGEKDVQLQFVPLTYALRTLTRSMLRKVILHLVDIQRMG
jgi:hypothetical protein